MKRHKGSTTRPIQPQRYMKESQGKEKYKGGKNQNNCKKTEINETVKCQKITNTDNDHTVSTAFCY